MSVRCTALRCSPRSPLRSRSRRSLPGASRSRCSTTSASARSSRSASCCSPASAARPRSARRRSSASRAYATAWLTTAHGASPWLGLLFALALTGVAALVDRRAHAAPGRSLPAALARSRGACRSRCCSATSNRSGATAASSNVPALAIGRWSLADAARDVLPDLGARRRWRCLFARNLLRLATGPGDARPARRRDRCSRASAPTRCAFA